MVPVLVVEMVPVLVVEMIPLLENPIVDMIRINSMEQTVRLEVVIGLLLAENVKAPSNPKRPSGAPRGASHPLSSFTGPYFKERAKPRELTFSTVTNRKQGTYITVPSWKEKVNR
jgi:hypothetical protein